MKKTSKGIVSILLCAVLIAGLSACNMQTWSFEGEADETGCVFSRLEIGEDGKAAIRDAGRVNKVEGGYIIGLNAGEKANGYLENTTDPSEMQGFIGNYEQIKTRMAGEGRKPVRVMQYAVMIYYFIGVDGDGEYYVYPFSDTTSVGVLKLDEFVDAAVRYHAAGEALSGGNWLLFD